MPIVPKNEIRVINGRIYDGGQEYPDDAPVIKEKDKAVEESSDTSVPAKPKKNKKGVNSNG